MTKKRLLAGLMCLSLCTLFVLPYVVGAVGEAPDIGGQLKTFRGVATGVEAEPTELQTVIGRIVNFLLGFLGIVAVVIILWGGFSWMVAGGNTEKVEGAQKILTAGIIGLVIVLAAWAIAKFVIDMMLKAIA